MASFLLYTGYQGSLPPCAGVVIVDLVYLDWYILKKQTPGMSPEGRTKPAGEYSAILVLSLEGSNYSPWIFLEFLINPR